MLSIVVIGGGPASSVRHWRKFWWRTPASGTVEELINSAARGDQRVVTAMRRIFAAIAPKPPRDATSGGQITLEWSNGLFVPVQGPAGFDKLAAEAKADEVFLTILKRFNAQGRNAADRKGTSYAPALFAEEPDDHGITRRKKNNENNAVADVTAARFATPWRS